MNGGICENCKSLGKCEFTRNKAPTYTTYCRGYKPTKPTVTNTEKKPSDSDKLERLRDHLDDVEQRILNRLRNAEDDEKQFLYGIRSAIIEIKNWV